MSEIKNIYAREILDSRGNPAVEVEVESVSGVFGRASVPSGASTGSGEAMELRDGDSSRFNGAGVLEAVRNVEDVIRGEITGMDLCDQCGIDRTMIDADGTPDKSRLGANAMLAVSLACARTAAMELHLPLYRYLGGVNGKILPVPMMNMINGGAHSSMPVVFQEFMIRPVGAGSFSEALNMGWQVFRSCREVLAGMRCSTAVGDEGGFAPENLPGGIRGVLDVMMKSVEKSGLLPGKDITFALDAAASEFFREGVYDYGGGKVISGDEQIAFMEELCREYPIDSIEDPLAEGEWEMWRKLTAALGSKCQLVGDDLFVTNAGLLRKGAELQCGNAILIKPNQAGTLTETMDTVENARRLGYKCIISHRSGETEDSFIADLAVAVNAGQIKCGALCRGERMVKYNQLLRIEEQLDITGEYGVC